MYSFVKPTRTIGGMLHSRAYSIDAYDRQGVVYCVPCSNCDLLYIGETKRNFNKRKKAPFSAI